MSERNDLEFEKSPEIQEAAQQLRNGELGRRDFLRRVVVLGGSSAFAFGLLKESEAIAQQPIQPNRYGGPAATYPPANTYPPSTIVPPATTQALGEEGQPSPTTMSVGEEGTVAPSTSAYGEEQGPPQVTTHAVGEESGPAPTTTAVGEEGGTVTTFAVGEEQPPRPNCKTPRPTTSAYGEEGGTPPPPQPTTFAVGEETQTLPTPPQATTFAVGEETQTLPTPPTYRPPTNVSTRVVGEEGTPSNGRTSRPIRSRIESGLKNPLPKVWNSFRRW